MGVHWVFPLPNGFDATGRRRGENLASTALQVDWALEADEFSYGPHTHPEKLHQFIRTTPGLFQTARLHPGYPALYAPQLTIPGFDEGFEDVFDEFMQVEKGPNYFRIPSSKTVDGSFPLCDAAITWRHPSYGNFKIEEIARAFTDLHEGDSYRNRYKTFENLVWLLSNDSDWMPVKYRNLLLDGMRKGGFLFPSVSAIFWTPTDKKRPPWTAVFFSV